MNALAAHARRAAWLALCLALGSVPGVAAVTVSAQVDPPEISVDQEANVTVTIRNGSVGDFNLPQVDGLQIAGKETQSGITIINGSMSSSMSVSFAIIAGKPGDYTIPAFDIATPDGGTLHVNAMKLRVLSSATAPPSSAAPPGSNTAQAQNANPGFNPAGPVIMPPANSSPGAPTNNATPSATDSSGNAFVPPTEPDGSTARVFVRITPKTTDAYVGELIPMRIEFYIRNDVDYQQDSLPTIDGSDFLMNDLSVHPDEQSVIVDNQGYRCESWVTAIEAPKSGDFPLVMERDTYWIKSLQNTPVINDPFGFMSTTRPVLAHDNIPSNRLVIHVHALPDQGRPANFTGAIGQFKVTADAAPTSVEVGDPVQLHFAVTGDGNFSYVQSPSLAADPNWKTYNPVSKVDFVDESHSEGTKTFTQSIIPKKNGHLPLPAASFSYFDPMTKQYVTAPIPLPAIDVTGTVPLAAAAPATGPDESAPAATSTSNADAFLPNRIELGSLQSSLAPAYQKLWFWVLQGFLLGLLIAGIVVSRLRSGKNGEEARAERARRRNTLHQEEDAMREAVRQGDAQAFFLAARHAVQLHLGGQWHIRPEAITLAEVRARDPQLAAALEPIFAQADEIIYSGGAGEVLDLAQWEIRVRECLQQLQPA